ncbi:hypothetical protein ENBRE01_3003, partial [Enteropsectra breve]
MFTGTGIKATLFLILCIASVACTQRDPMPGTELMDESGAPDKTKCKICREPLIFSAHKYDEKLKNFLDLHTKSVIQGADFYKHAVVKCTVEECGDMFHLVCARNEAKSQQENVVVLENADNSNYGCFYCSFCQDLTQVLNVHERIVLLSKITEDTPLVLRFILSTLDSLGEDYLSVLEKAEPQPEDLLQIYRNIQSTNSPYRRYFMACIGLYSARYSTKDPGPDYDIIRNYLSALPRGLRLCNPKFLVGYFGELVAAKPSAVELKKCIFVFLEAIQPKHQEVFRRLYIKMIIAYYKASTRNMFSRFFTECLFSDKCFVLKWGFFVLNKNTQDAAILMHIAIRTLSFDAVLLELEKRMSDEKKAKEILCSQRYKEFIPVVVDWLYEKSNLPMLTELYFLLKRFFKLRSKETATRYSGNLSFFGVYKRLFIDKTGSIRTFIYDELISAILERYEVRFPARFIRFMAIFSFNEKWHASDKAAGCYKFMDYVINKEYVFLNSKVDPMLVDSKKIYEINMIARHLDCGSNDQQVNMLRNNSEKITDFNISQAFSMNSLAFRVIIADLSKRTPNREYEEFFRQRCTHRCAYGVLYGSFVSELYLRFAHQDSGFLPLCLSKGVPERTLNTSDIWEWCESVDLYGSLLDSDILLQSESPYLKHFAVEMLEYCLWKDSENEYPEIKGLVVKPFIRLITEKYDGFNRLFNVLFKTKYPYELINMCYYYADDKTKHKMLESICTQTLPPKGLLPVDILTLKNVIALEYEMLNFVDISFDYDCFNSKEVLGERFLSYLKTMEEREKNASFKSVMEDSILLAWIAGTEEEPL